MKRLMLILMLSLVMTIGMSLTAMAEEDVSVTLNGVELAFDSSPYIFEGRTLVPVRTITEAIGAEVGWDSEQKIITISHDVGILYMRIGSNAYTLNADSYIMETAPEIKDSRTMVPLRFVAETFGFDVGWEADTRTVTLMKEGVEVDQSLAVPSYSQEELLWLARIVYLEGLDIGYEPKLAIANVVLNRVKSDLFPDTVYGVIKDDNYAIQFPPAHRSSFDSLVPDAQSLEAAGDALSGSNNIENCLYFNNSPFKWKADDLYTVIEGEYFYK